MTTGSAGHSATLLNDGKVLVVSSSESPTAELYDPDGGTWTATGSTDEGRYHHTATLLRDGKVLVVGGGGSLLGLPLASALLYDPGSGRWTATGPMKVGRARHAATLLRDGTVARDGRREGP